jgi:hypothetical protein
LPGGFLLKPAGCSSQTIDHVNLFSAASTENFTCGAEKIGDIILIEVIVMNLNLKEKYLTDEKGRKEAVVLEVKAYGELLEDLEDLAIIADRKNEPTISWEEMKKRLK